MSKIVLNQEDITDAIINAYSTYNEQIFKRFDFDNLEIKYNLATSTLTIEAEGKI